MLSLLDIFRIGIGPSSSHTVGPLRIGARFLEALARGGKLDRVAKIHVELQGSLALTGVGHGTPRASILGLAGFKPNRFDPDAADAVMAQVENENRLPLGNGPVIAFDPKADVDLAGHIVPDLHPNGMRLTARDGDGEVLCDKTYYSTGGGFIASQRQLEKPAKQDKVGGGPQVPYPFGSAEELLALCAQHGLTIAQLMLANEGARRSEEKTIAGIDRIAEAMDACIERGLTQEGILPGGLRVSRRAPDLWRTLQATPQSNEREQLFDWLNCYAMAVNEENAIGGCGGDHPRGHPLLLRDGGRRTLPRQPPHIPADGGRDRPPL